MLDEETCSGDEKNSDIWEEKGTYGWTIVAQVGVGPSLPRRQGTGRPFIHHRFSSRTRCDVACPESPNSYSTDIDQSPKGQERPNLGHSTPVANLYPPSDSTLSGERRKLLLKHVCDRLHCGAGAGVPESMTVVETQNSLSDLPQSTTIPQETVATVMACRPGSCKPLYFLSLFETLQFQQLARPKSP
jgi:hypothetical protein